MRTTLGELLNATSDSVRLGAARAVLELGVRLRETEELELRIASLEQRVPSRTEVTPWAA